MVDSSTVPGAYWQAGRQSRDGVVMDMTAGMLWLVVMVLGPTFVGAEETPTERRLRLLEEQLKRAQQEIDRLKGEIQQQKAIGQATQKQAEQATETAQGA